MENYNILNNIRSVVIHYYMAMGIEFQLTSHIFFNFCGSQFLLSCKINPPLKFL